MWELHLQDFRLQWALLHRLFMMLQWAGQPCTNSTLLACSWLWRCISIVQFSKLLLRYLAHSYCILCSYIHSLCHAKFTAKQLSLLLAGDQSPIAGSHIPRHCHESVSTRHWSMTGNTSSHFCTSDSAVQHFLIVLWHKKLRAGWGLGTRQLTSELSVINLKQT